MRRTLAAIGVSGLALFVAGACADDRPSFVEENSFVVDASADAPQCGLRCSLDGRSILQTCTGEVVETCPPDQACGAARCQEPCAAAAADKSSNGCEFFLQMPQRLKERPQSCYAAYLVNVSPQPVDLALEYKGQALDLSKAVFRTNPDGPTLTHHTGPIPPGETVVLFVADRDPNKQRSVAERFFYVGCPEGAVPAYARDIDQVFTGIGDSFQLKASAPVSAVAIFPFGSAGLSYVTSATLLLPVTSWANEHMIVTAWEQANTWKPATQIVAAEDGTEVTVVPTHDIQDGVGVVGTAAKRPVTYKLDKGQHLQFHQTESLSGSLVRSNKPTTIFAGHECANVPTDVGTCDTLHQQLPPFKQWGHEYVGVGYRPRLGNERESVAYRIVAARDGTLLDYDPVVPRGAPVELAAGEEAVFSSGTGEPFVVRTQDPEHPIYLAAYMSGGGGDFVTRRSLSSRGDPDFVNVVPAGQYMSSYSFYADPTYEDTSLVIVRAKQNGRFEDVWLECAGTIGAATGEGVGFRPIGNRGEYEFARVDLSKAGGPGDRFGDSVCRTGLQRMRSEGPFTATLWGWDLAVSYAFTGGMAQRTLVEEPLLPIR